MGTEPGTAVSTEFTPSEVDDLRSLAVTQIKRHRKLKLRAAAFGLGMLVLVPVWVIVEYLSAAAGPSGSATTATRATGIRGSSGLRSAGASTSC